MSCEICGADIRGWPVKIRVEGAVLTVCNRCVDLGEKVIERRNAPRFVKDGGQKSRGSPKATPRVNTAQARPPPKKRAPREEDLEIVENHADIIRAARGSMSFEEFAATLREKSTVIQKIESGKLRPTIKLAKMIEKQYHVSLVEVRDMTDEVEGDAWKDDKKDYAPTLGDFVKRKE